MVKELLSPMQRRILLFAAEGRKSSETATAMGLSLTATERQLWRIRKKMNARNTAHAVALAIRSGMIE